MHNTLLMIYSVLKTNGVKSANYHLADSCQLLQGLSLVSDNY